MGFCNILMILLQKKLADLAAAQGYLRAHGDSHGAAKALAHSLRWREETQPELAVCGACAEDPRSHNMRVVAWLPNCGWVGGFGILFFKVYIQVLFFFHLCLDRFYNLES